MSTISCHVFMSARSVRDGWTRSFGHFTNADVQIALDAGFGFDEVLWMFDLTDRSALDAAAVERSNRGKS